MDVLVVEDVDLSDGWGTVASEPAHHVVVAPVRVEQTTQLPVSETRHAELVHVVWASVVKGTDVVEGGEGLPNLCGHSSDVFLWCGLLLVLVGPNAQRELAGLCAEEDSVGHV